MEHVQVQGARIWTRAAAADLAGLTRPYDRGSAAAWGLLLSFFCGEVSDARVQCLGTPRE